MIECSFCYNVASKYARSSDRGVRKLRYANYSCKVYAFCHEHANNDYWLNLAKLEISENEYLLYKAMEKL